MSHAETIVACENCRPDEWDTARETMEKILLGDRTPENWLCPDHREEMNETTREWAEEQELSD